MKYYVVNVDRGLDIADDLAQIAYEQCNCIGQCDFEMEEQEIDVLLGERAFSGGDIPEELIDEVIESQKGQGQRLFFSSLKDAQMFVDNGKEIQPDMNYIINEKDEVDWNESWRKHYKAIEIKGLLTIIPSWQKEKAEFNEILLYPGQGFGTGSHETTILCLEHLRELKLGGASKCLDFGCGSGILGIAAMKLFNCQVDFCDIDSAALDNCLQNIVLNFDNQNLSGTSLILRERYEEKIRYDLIFANILESIIIEEKEILLKALSQSGMLVISGILKGQETTIIKEFGSEVKLIGRSEKNDWASLVFEKI